MNKRTRLKRRILRDHRGRGTWAHMSIAWQDSTLVVHDFWRCPHCQRAYRYIPMRAPRAYR